MDRVESLAELGDEQVVVTERSRTVQPLTQSQLTPHHLKRARAQHDLPVFACLGDVLVHAGHSGFRHADHPVDRVEVSDDERNLFRGPEAREESELVVVALGLAPVAVNRGESR